MTKKVNRALDSMAEPDYTPPTTRHCRLAAQVAQLVEHATENRSVGGSIPSLGTKKPVRPAG
jgi:hypothetical protein